MFKKGLAIGLVIGLVLGFWIGMLPSLWIAQYHPYVLTDKTMYNYGDTLDISFGGFAPNGKVSIDLNLPDRNSSYGLGTLSVDANGAGHLSFQLGRNLSTYNGLAFVTVTARMFPLTFFAQATISLVLI